MARKSTTVDAYFEACSPEIRPLMAELRRFVHATLPGATEAMDYGVPVFRNAHGVPVLYLYGAKAHVNFGFLRSAELEDPDRVLKGSGKPSKHVRLVPGAPVDTDRLAGFVTQCIGIDA